jgi:hypothetical protein
MYLRRYFSLSSCCLSSNPIQRTWNDLLKCSKKGRGHNVKGYGENEFVGMEHMTASLFENFILKTGYLLYW